MPDVEVGAHVPCGLGGVPALKTTGARCPCWGRVVGKLAEAGRRARDAAALWSSSCCTLPRNWSRQASSLLSVAAPMQDKTAAAERDQENWLYLTCTELRIEVSSNGKTDMFTDLVSTGPPWLAGLRGLPPLCVEFVAGTGHRLAWGRPGSCALSGGRGALKWRRGPVALRAPFHRCTPFPCPPFPAPGLRAQVPCGMVQGALWRQCP